MGTFRTLKADQRWDRFQSSWRQWTTTSKGRNFFFYLLSKCERMHKCDLWELLSNSWRQEMFRYAQAPSFVAIEKQSIIWHNANAAYFMKLSSRILKKIPLHNQLHFYNSQTNLMQMVSLCCWITTGLFTKLGSRLRSTWTKKQSISTCSTNGFLRPYIEHSTDS